MSEFLTLQEAADRLSVTPRTIRKQIRDGNLLGYYLGRQILRVKAADVDALLTPKSDLL